MPAAAPFDALLAGLRRAPDIEVPELRAWDAADRYLLETAAPFIAAAPDRPVIVVDDTHGALSLGAAALGAPVVRGHSDSLIARRAIAQNAARLGGAAVLEPVALETLMTPDARLALVRLPRSLDRLDALVRHLTATAHDDLVVVAGNMVKHMTPTQNEVLRRGFAQLDVTLARGKARLLIARGPIALPPAEPARGQDPDSGLQIVALPGVFAGASLDIGTRSMLATFDSLPTYDTAIDLACGSGVLACALARNDSGARVIATDVSEIAVRSAAMTAEANAVRVETVHDDGLARQPDASADLIVLNPPFHVGAAVHTGIALRLFADAARVLRPGGELWAVWNSPLGYAPALERLVGPTLQLARTPKFTVTASKRRER